jgi:phosphoglycerate dehydrogenase-like enzyme
MVRVAVLDDWQNIARASADWSKLEARADVEFFSKPFANEQEAAAALAEFDIIIAMRERTAFSASLLTRLPKLRMIALTGMRAASLDLEACTKQGILVCNTAGGRSLIATAELTLGLLLTAARHIPLGDQEIRNGRFQEGLRPGIILNGLTLGIIGLGRIGTLVAGYGKGLGMRVLAWSPHLTAERAQAGGAEYADKPTLLSTADAVSIHMPLSPTTRGLLGQEDLARLKPGAILINTSRGPLIDEAALLSAVQSGRIIAALDVFDREPLPPEHPLRRAPNTVLTPHIGYNVGEVFPVFYRESIENVLAFLDGTPIRMLNPEVQTAKPA